jgi:sugar phosphate isomerase/epimerase
MIRIGNQTSKVASPFILPFEYAMDNGFNAFEWFPDKDASGKGWEEQDLNMATRRWVRDCGIKRDIRFSVHAPLREDPLGSDPVAGFMASLNLFGDIGASLFNIHFPPEQADRTFFEAIRPLILYIKSKNGQLAIENVPSTSPEDINMFFGYLKNAKVSAQDVGLCLDLGHANLHNATRNDYLRYLHEIHRRVPVIHIHAHENYGDKDAHLPLFSGPAGTDDTGIHGFAEWLKRREFDGSIILEQWPDPPDLLVDVRTKLRDMLFPGDRE